MSGATLPHEPVTDEAGRIAADYFCTGCEYNLRTLALDSACPDCGRAVAETVEARRALAGNPLDLRRFSIWSRLGYAALGGILPLICFFMAAGESPFYSELWQDGNLGTYMQLLYGGWPLIAFWPLLFYAIVCMAAVLYWPMQAGQHLAVRFGIYTGVVLALQYLFILSAAVGGITMMLLMLLGIVGFIAIVAVARVWLAKLPATMRRILPWVGLALVLSISPWLAVVLVVYAPATTLLVYAMLALRLRATEFDPPADRRTLAWLGLGWLAAYAASWSAAITLAIDAYSRLPTDYSGCYIATAAARGHRRLVGARPVRCADGRVMMVNRQLRVCKVAELALQALCPRGHGVLRAVYDTLGPPIARRMRQPLAADAAFLLIAPLALMAFVLLRVLCRDNEALLQRVYPGA